MHSFSMRGMKIRTCGDTFNRKSKGKTASIKAHARRNLKAGKRIDEMLIRKYAAKDAAPSS